MRKVAIGSHSLGIEKTDRLPFPGSHSTSRSFECRPTLFRSVGSSRRIPFAFKSIFFARSHPPHTSPTGNDLECFDGGRLGEKDEDTSEAGLAETYVRRVESKDAVDIEHFCVSLPVGPRSGP